MKGGFTFLDERDVRDVAALVKQRRQYGGVEHDEPLRQTAGGSQTYFWGSSGYGQVAAGFGGDGWWPNPQDMTTQYLSCPAGSIINGIATVTSLVKFGFLTVEAMQGFVYKANLETFWQDDPSQAYLTRFIGTAGNVSGYEWGHWGWPYGETIYSNMPRNLTYTAHIPIYGDNRLGTTARAIQFAWRPEAGVVATALIQGITAVFSFR